MRYFYVVRKSVWRQHLSLFDPRQGSHYLNLNTDTDPLLLVCAAFGGESQQEKWESNPEVGVLPDPVFEGTMTLKAASADPAKTLTHEHVAALRDHPHFKAKDTHTVLDIAKQASKAHPLMRLRHMN